MTDYYDGPRKGIADLDGPALPDDRARFLEIEPLLEAELKIDDANHVRAQGDVKPFPNREWSGAGFVPLQVKWTRR